MIILYLILLNFEKVNAEVLVDDVEKSLEILRSMDKVHVAKGCVKLISEVLDIAKKQILSRQAQADVSPVLRSPEMSMNRNRTHGQQDEALARTSCGLFNGEVLSNLIDFNLLSDFAGFADMNNFSSIPGNVPMESDATRSDDCNESSYPYLDTQYFVEGGEDGVLLDVSPRPDMESDLLGTFNDIFSSY